MTLTLYGYPFSPYTQKSIVTFKETGTPFEFVPTVIPEEKQKTPEYLAKNPFGTVPTLVRCCLRHRERSCC
jgi:glutathione S-transferase